jgi:hypothetical protein
MYKSVRQQYRRCCCCPVNMMLFLKYSTGVLCADGQILTVIVEASLAFGKFHVLTGLVVYGKGIRCGYTFNRSVQQMACGNPLKNCPTPDGPSCPGNQVRRMPATADHPGRRRNARCSWCSVLSSSWDKTTVSTAERYRRLRQLCSGTNWQQVWLFHFEWIVPRSGSARRMLLQKLSSSRTVRGAGVPTSGLSSKSFS